MDQVLWIRISNCVHKSMLQKNVKTVINLAENTVVVGLYFCALAAPGP